MTDLAQRHLAGLSRGTVIDIGSLDVNGTYRPIFQALGWRYRGADAELARMSRLCSKTLTACLLAPAALIW